MFKQTLAVSVYRDLCNNLSSNSRKPLDESQFWLNVPPHWNIMVKVTYYLRAEMLRSFFQYSFISSIYFEWLSIEFRCVACDVVIQKTRGNKGLETKKLRPRASLLFPHQFRYGLIGVRST